MSEHTCGGRGPVPCPACGDLAAQERYARQWREQHPRGTWGDIWVCPLCGKAIQTTIESARYHTGDVEGHRVMHGEDWLVFRAAGEQEAAGGDRRSGVVEGEQG